IPDPAEAGLIPWPLPVQRLFFAPPPASEVRLCQVVSALWLNDVQFFRNRTDTPKGGGQRPDHRWIIRRPVIILSAIFNLGNESNCLFSVSKRSCAQQSGE